MGLPRAPSELILVSSISNSTSVMSSFYQGPARLPSENYYTKCTLGVFPEYVVETTKVAQMQLAANFARTHTLRLMITNTGHDFNGRSLGSGALSIWTNKLKRLEFYKDYNAPTHTRSAMKVGDEDLIYERTLRSWGRAWCRCDWRRGQGCRLWRRLHCWWRALPC